MYIKIAGGSGFLGTQLCNGTLHMFGKVGSVSLRTENWLLELAKSNVVINLVGKAHDHSGTAEEKDYFHVNLELTQQVFSAFLKSSAHLLIHVSSIAAIEEFESSSPLKESDTCNPASWYGKSKRAAEEWLLAQELPSNKKLIILRPPMVHGPGDKGNLGLLYKLVSKGIPYPLASFDNKRSFISIDNFSFFIQKIIEQQECLDSGIYHIADDEPMSTKQIIDIIKRVTGNRVPDLSLPKFVVKGLARVGDIIPFPLNTKRLKKMTSNLLVSNSKIKQALNIEGLPLTAEEGLEKTIRSFHKVY